MPRAPHPEPRRVRLESLDLLRGIAVLGIFAVNVQAFAMTPFGYSNPTLEADFGPAGQAIWALTVALFQGKFITIFSALFGAGVLLMSGEGEDPARDRLHLRRMAWLLAIGLGHAFLLWYGDILVAYAVCGLLLLGVRGWSARNLAVGGILLTLFSIALIALATLSAAGLPPEDYAKMVAEAWAPPPATIAELRTDFLMPWPARVAALAEFATEREVEQLFYYLPRFLGLMMLGMALAKSGLFEGRWPARRLWAAAALAPLGALASWGLARAEIAQGFELLAILPAQTALAVVALPQALGYAALAVLTAQAQATAMLRAPFVATGRMALTGYLGCSLAGALVFYGPPGLGLIGELTRAEQAFVVLGVWAGLLVLSTVWLQAFAFGPAEWAWRSLTYGRPQPMAKR